MKNALLALGLALLVGLYAPAQPNAQETTGPNGEKAVPSSTLTLDQAEIDNLKTGKYTAALLWHTSSDFVTAVTAGATDAFNSYGIEVVATTDAGFDAARQ